jgi:hypothetical protein
MAFVLSAPAGCAALGSSDSGPRPGADLLALDSSAAHVNKLPPGVYYAGFRSDESKIVYYSLAQSPPRVAGEAVIDSGDCTISPSNPTLILDGQGMLDIYPVCSGHAGIMQLAAGVAGHVRPMRQITTSFAKDAFLEGDIDTLGDVAVGYVAFHPTDPQINRIFVYTPRASGQSKPQYALSVTTRACTSPAKLGPGPLMGSPRSGVAFDGLNRLVLGVGPPPAATCGYEYIERFSLGSHRMLDWFIPGLLQRSAHGRQPFQFNPAGFLTARNGDLLFGIYTMTPKGVVLRAGGATYGKYAKGVQPQAKSIFSFGAASSVGGKSVTNAFPVGVDHLGRQYIQNERAGTVIYVIAPEASGQVNVLRTIHLPQEIWYYDGVVIDVR